MNEFDFPLPPPTFEFLVFSLKSQAEMQLGMMVFGQEASGEPNLPATRHLIEMLAMLNEKTRGNLSIEEQRLLENSLTELRFRYVQVNEQQAKAKADQGSSQAGADGLESTGSESKAAESTSSESVSSEAGETAPRGGEDKAPE